MMISRTRRNIDQRFVVIVFLVFLITGGFLCNRIELTQNVFRVNFIPQNFKRCEDLVQNRSKYGMELSQIYQLKIKEFENVILNAIKAGGVEGHSGQVTGQYLVMHHLAGQPAAKRICETGFNLGHSSFNYLTANENSIVHSFDLGNHDYAHTLSDYLKKVFPTRFFIHFGDSTKTIPEFIRNNPDFRCDFIFVDGGHVYPVASADLKNFAKIANLKENIIIFDDYPTKYGQSFGKAWDDVVKDGIVKEHMRCTFQQYDGWRGFTLGRVMKKTTEDLIVYSWQWSNSVEHLHKIIQLIRQGL